MLCTQFRKPIFERTEIVKTYFSRYLSFPFATWPTKHQAVNPRTLVFIHVRVDKLAEDINFTSRLVNIFECMVKFYKQYS